MKHLLRTIYMSVILLFGMVIFVYAYWSGEKVDIPQVVHGEETTEAMTEKDAIKILFYYLYPAYENDAFDSLGEFVCNKDGEYYEYRTLADKENGDFHARMQIWFDGVTDDDEYYIFSVFVYYYDNISKKQERDSYHSSLISGYAVNRKNGDVMEERWQDDNGLWVYNDKFREIKQALKSNAGKMEICEKYKGLNSNLFDSNFLNWAGRDMIEKGIYEYAVEEQEFTSVINQKSKIPKELIVLLEKAFYDSNLSKISEQDSPYFEVINKFVAEEFVIPREFEEGQKGNGKVIQYEEGFYYVSLLYNQEIEEFDGIRLCGLASDMEGEQVSIRYLPEDYVWKLVYENTLTNISYNNKHIKEYLDSIGKKLFIDEYLDNGNSDVKKIFYGEKELSSDYVLKDDCWLRKVDVGNCGLPIYVLKKYAPSYTESSQDFMVKFYIYDTKDDMLIKLRHLSKDEWSGTDSLVQMWFEEIDENIYTFRMYHISDYNYLLNIALLEEDRLTMIQTYVIVPKKTFVVNKS